MSLDDDQPATGAIAAVMATMQDRLRSLPVGQRGLKAFLATYLRTTAAVGTAVDRGSFEDGPWVESWDVAFANLYLRALDAHLGGGAQVARPWRLAFGASPSLPPLRHVLLGINAHINYDLPQALLAVISDDDFAKPQVIGRRQRDHQRIDGVLAARVSAEDVQLRSVSHVTVLDRVLRPANEAASKRFLREARQKVWHNTRELQRARLDGPEEFATRLAELEVLSAAKINDLLAPGQVLLRLAVSGFGVTLPPPG